MMKILQSILAWFARAILRKYHPRIIGITGSVGKSSSKEAAVAVLRQRFHVRGSQKNYNNELGVPLAIINAEAAGTSLFGWLAVFIRAARLLAVRENYPEVLVLEMGADHKGDIKYLVTLAPPEIGVLTSIAPVHTEFLGDLGGVREEKKTLIASLPTHGVAVLSEDDEIVRGVAGETRARVLTYGFDESAEVRAVEYALHFRPGEDLHHAGTYFKIAHEGAVVPTAVFGVLGRQHVEAALAGAAVGLAMGMNLAEIGLGLRGYEPPHGRMNLIAGVKHTVIIDDTYNASPRATLEALETLRQLEITERERRIAVLADMKELGAYEEEGHRAVGKRVAEIGIDLLVTVGELAGHIASGAREAGLPDERVFHFGLREEAGKFLQSRIRKGDIILVKGSQSARMELVVKELMAEPLRAAELLVRQEKAWES